MSRVPLSVPRPRRVAVVAVVAALTLAGCGSAPKVAEAPVVGVPSLSIVVPLSTVGCTGSNSCIALGANGSGSDVAPYATGQVRHANGVWSPLSLPSVPSGTVSSTSCWNTGCLIGGSQTSGDLLWLYDAAAAVTSSPSPAGGQGVSALSCFHALSCALIDSRSMTGGSRLSFTGDGGATWTTPTPIAWLANDPPTALSCADDLDCLVAARPGGQLAIEVTHDAGATWTALAAPPSWTALTSLSCARLRCVGLAATPTRSLVVRTRNFATTWTKTALTGHASALACTTSSRCVAVGQDSRNVPWLATVQGSKSVTVSLKYVPTPLVDVACDTRICAAISVSTVLALTP